MYVAAVAEHGSTNLDSWHLRTKRESFVAAMKQAAIGQQADLNSTALAANFKTLYVTISNWQ